jgi:hypothetical protein
MGLVLYHAIENVEQMAAQGESPQSDGQEHGCELI